MFVQRAHELRQLRAVAQGRKQYAVGLLRWHRQAVGHQDH
jgi:hypothetical protein